MITTYELKKQWNRLLTTRGMSESLPIQDGKLLTDTEFAVLCHIAHQGNKANITSLVNHPYFVVTSLSTVKRAVTRLISGGLVHVTDVSNDRRERMLEVTGLE
jgi:DNA-binding MarR family transcriptional regulator